MNAVITRNAPTSAAPFRIRKARRGDMDALAALMGELGYANAPDASTVHWVLSHPEIEVLVAADTMDKPIGFLSLSHRPQLRMKGRMATIDELVVAQAWRRRGVARELVKSAIERCKTLSVKRVEVVTHNPRGHEVREFYEKCGFGEANTMVLRLGELDFQKR